MARAQRLALFEPTILSRAAKDSLLKLNPVQLIRNPVIFVTEVVAALTTALGIRDLLTGAPFGFALAIERCQRLIHQ